MSLFASSLSVTSSPTLLHPLSCRFSSRSSHLSFVQPVCPPDFRRPLRFNVPLVVIWAMWLGFVEGSAIHPPISSMLLSLEPSVSTSRVQSSIRCCSSVWTVSGTPKDCFAVPRPRLPLHRCEAPENVPRRVLDERQSVRVAVAAGVKVARAETVAAAE
jgi:hypothetical protein